MKFNKRSILIVLGSAILFVLCILAFINANFGSDSITVFEDGLHAFFHISIGTATLIYNISVVVLGLLVSRKNIGWGTIINGFTIGILLSLLEPFLSPFFTISTGLPFRIFLLCLGMILGATGCALLIVGEAGMSALDALATVFGNKVHIEFRYARIIFDAVLMMTGFLLGGTVGIGSVIATLGMGPLISVVVDFFKKINL